MGTKYDTIVNIQITYKTLWQNLTTIQQLCNNLIQIKDEFPNINVWLDLSLQDRSSHGLQIFLSLWILFCRMGRLIGIFHDDVASPALCWRPCHKSFSGIAHHPSQLCGNPWYAYSRHSFAQMLVHKLHTWTLPHLRTLLHSRHFVSSFLLAHPCKIKCLLFIHWYSFNMNCILKP